MEINIDGIELLLSKKVPKHGKVSGVRSKREAVRVIIPTENTKLSLKVSDPSEVLLRNVTPDGKILGLSNFIGKYIFIVDQNQEELNKETGTTPLFCDPNEEEMETIESLYKMCEKYNLDPDDLIKKMLESFRRNQSGLEK